MCTVSFIPLKSGYIITSNRDERKNRGVAQYPGFYELNGKKLVFPKDPKAGGTWFISNDNGDTGVLLNGALENHVPETKYRKSRGHVLLEIFQSDSPIDALMGYDPEGIENFRIILWQEKQLNEVIWDGKDLKSVMHLSDQAHIWSSVTLYSNDMILERHNWFYDWLKYRDIITQEDIMDFHCNTHLDNKEYGLLISRNNNIATNSTTSLFVENFKARILHRDFLQNAESVLNYDFKKGYQIHPSVYRQIEVDE